MKNYSQKIFAESTSIVEVNKNKIGKDNGEDVQVVGAHINPLACATIEPPEATINLELKKDIKDKGFNVLQATAKSLNAVNNKNENVNEPAKNTHLNPFVTTPAETELSTEGQERRLKVLHLELDMSNQEGRRVPQLSSMKPQHWEHVLSLPTKSARNKYYAYLWQVERKKEANLRHKVENAVAVLERKEGLRKQHEECQHITYGLGHTSYFLRIYDTTINHWQNNRLTRAMLYSPKIVLDCGYDEHMTRREAQNAAKQLMLCFAENRMHAEPFDLHFCNVNLRGVCMQGLQRFIPTMLQPEFPMNLHEKCFSQVFSKENIVYLTPHCRTDLTVFNPDDVYIIGAMVDTVS